MISTAECVPSAGYIASVFWKQNIAKVSSITIIPYLKNNKVAQMVYIDIANWCDNEAAYNFIRRLKMPEGEARIQYNTFNEKWWAVQINTHYIGQLLLGVYTEVFPQCIFDNEKQVMRQILPTQEPLYDNRMRIEELCDEKLSTEEMFCVKEQPTSPSSVMEEENDLTWFIGINHTPATIGCNI
jgi:hypothetical protein